MRQMRSFGSAKAISLDRDDLIRRLRDIAAEALGAFPELREVRLVGSLAAGTHTGTSDVDLLLRVDHLGGNPLEAMRPYFFFFSTRLSMSLDLFLAGPQLSPEAERLLPQSLVLAARP